MNFQNQSAPRLALHTKYGGNDDEPNDDAQPDVTHDVLTRVEGVTPREAVHLLPPSRHHVPTPVDRKRVIVCLGPRSRPNWVKAAALPQKVDMNLAPQHHRDNNKHKLTNTTQLLLICTPRHCLSLVSKCKLLFEISKL